MEAPSRWCGDEDGGASTRSVGGAPRCSRRRTTGLFDHKKADMLEFAPPAPRALAS